MLKAIPLVLDSRPTTPVVRSLEAQVSKNKNLHENVAFGSNAPRYPTQSIPTGKALGLGVGN